MAMLAEGGGGDGVEGGGDGSGWWGGVKGLKFTTFQSGIKRNKITFLKLKLEGRNINIKRLFMLTSSSIYSNSYNIYLTLI